MLEITVYEGSGHPPCPATQFPDFGVLRGSVRQCVPFPGLFQIGEFKDYHSSPTRGHFAPCYLNDIASPQEPSAVHLGHLRSAIPVLGQGPFVDYIYRKDYVCCHDILPFALSWTCASVSTATANYSSLTNPPF